MKDLNASQKIHRYKNDAIANIDLPESFTFPFYYTPHKLSLIAAEQIQKDILSKGILGHNFGLDPSQEGLAIGKMFGVLVILDEQEKLGFLAGFSGKIASSNHHEGFVPPVYDILDPNGFFLTEEEEINQLSRKIEKIEAKLDHQVLQRKHRELVDKSDKIVSQFKQEINARKKHRKYQRKIFLATKSEAEYLQMHESHKLESLQQQFEFRELKTYWSQKVEKSLNDLNEYLEPLLMLKRKRKKRSSDLQKRIFKEYSFFNIDRKRKSLNEIFHEEMDVIPPSGAGECAAPKLLHFAFKNNLKPVALAEFWWGSSPNSEIRNHQSYYPACRGKCEPILKHMLSGLKMDPNPMLRNAVDFELDIVYEDSAIIVINKPTEVLSVPGKTIEMSVLYKLRLEFPKATGPLLIHRLDMSTSGILIAAKNKEVHKDLQEQFMRRTVKKKYVAVLDGIVEKSEGIIDLPLRVDINDRPHQLVCFEHGKRSVTRYEVLGVENGKTRINFYPITGRTHQLRVHAAHSLGLACPIVGDDLYGTIADRLHLHAEELEIIHPITKETIIFKLPAKF